MIQVEWIKVLVSLTSKAVIVRSDALKWSPKSVSQLEGISKPIKERPK